MKICSGKTIPVSRKNSLNISDFQITRLIRCLILALTSFLHLLSMFGKGLIYFGLIAVVAAITSDSRYLRSKETTSYRNSTEYAKRFLESRRKLEETVRDPDHKKAWQTLEQVDGLKNTEIAIFVTSTDNNNERMMWER